MKKNLFILIFLSFLPVLVVSFGIFYHSKQNRPITEVNITDDLDLFLNSQYITIDNKDNIDKQKYLEDVKILAHNISNVLIESRQFSDGKEIMYTKTKLNGDVWEMKSLFKSMEDKDIDIHLIGNQKDIVTYENGVCYLIPNNLTIKYRQSSYNPIILEFLDYNLIEYLGYSFSSSGRKYQIFMYNNNLLMLIDEENQVLKKLYSLSNNYKIISVVVFDYQYSDAIIFPNDCRQLNLDRLSFYENILSRLFNKL